MIREGSPNFLTGQLVSGSTQLVRVSPRGQKVWRTFSEHKYDPRTPLGTTYDGFKSYMMTLILDRMTLTGHCTIYTINAVIIPKITYRP